MSKTSRFAAFALTHKHPTEAAELILELEQQLARAQSQIKLMREVEKAARAVINAEYWRTDRP